MRYLLVLLVCCFVGCGPTKPKSNPNRYLTFVAVYAGSTAIKETNIPAPTPDNPKPDKVVNWRDCEECGGKGWNGDSTHRFDCAKCDRNGDGDPVDPDDIHYTLEELAELALNSNKDTEDKDKAEVDTLWYTSLDYALGDAKENNKDIFVVLSGDKPDTVITDSKLKAYLKNSFTLLYIDTKNKKMLASWSKHDTNKISEKDTFVCVLNSDANYVSVNGTIYFSINDDTAEFQDILEQIKNREK